ncbi:MAG: hypothetical protein MUO76_19750 [Anaerolineaceae bacterium]|nr:hypothetical protein [Anaerolineaceae bacterium]
MKRYSKYINLLFLVLICFLMSNCTTNPEKQSMGTQEAETVRTENLEKQIIGTWETETLLTDGYGSRYVMILSMDFKEGQQCSQNLYFKVSHGLYNSVACSYVIDGNIFDK